MQFVRARLTGRDRVDCPRDRTGHNEYEQQEKKKDRLKKIPRSLALRATWMKVLITESLSQ